MSSGIPFTEDQLKDFECPVCLKVPREPPIYQCKSGHCICKVCHGKVTRCPVCRIPLGNDEIRNLILEKLLPNMKHNCENADHGCEVRDNKGPLELHEQECQYQLIDCVDLTCKEKVPLAFLLAITYVSRMSPSHCLGFIPRWQKIRENAPYVAELHAKRNQMILHMSRSAQSPERSLGTKLKNILFYRYLDYQFPRNIILDLNEDCY